MTSFFFIRKRLHRRARLVTLGSSRSRDNERTQNVRQILREPLFTFKNKKVSTSVYRNHHTLRMRRRRRKMSLELSSDELSEHHRDSLSDSELECSKPVRTNKYQASTFTRSMSQQRPTQASTEMTVGSERQHRRLQGASVPRINFDNTTPEELASYFDQLLYFPKPMSAMAEMMYTWVHYIPFSYLL